MLFFTAKSHILKEREESFIFFIPQNIKQFTTSFACFFEENKTAMGEAFYF